MASKKQVNIMDGSRSPIITILMLAWPVFVDQMLQKRLLSVRVIPTKAIWFGVTYKEDRPGVVESLRRLHAEGIYK